jgi:hypothetical protein
MPDFNIKVHASLGALSSAIECFENNPDGTELCSAMMVVGEVFHNLFGTDGNLESRVDQMISLFENNKIVICGVAI